MESSCPRLGELFDVKLFDFELGLPRVLPLADGAKACMKAKCTLVNAIHYLKLLHSDFAQDQRSRPNRLAVHLSGENKQKYVQSGHHLIEQEVLCADFAF